jgi:hypothetical protein
MLAELVGDNKTYKQCYERSKVL